MPSVFETHVSVAAVLLASSLLVGCEIGDVDGDYEDEAEISEDYALNVAGGGYVISERSFPAVGVIGGSGRCTGTAISPRVVLTAAHCYDGWNSGNNYISYSNRQKAYFDQRGSAGRLGVTSITIHPSYDKDNRYNRWDLALVRVDDTMIDFIRVDARTPADNRWFLDVGYGQTAQDSSDFGTKRFFTNQIDELDEHHYQYNNQTSRGTRPTSCFGDSGGPMMVWNSGWRIVAVNSRLRRGNQWEGCHDADHYAARVDIAYDWIAKRL